MEPNGETEGNINHKRSPPRNPNEKREEQHWQQAKQDIAKQQDCHSESKGSKHNGH